MYNGFLLLDKAEGLNSFKLVMALRRIAGQKRVGYAGTLDPLATGLMVMALGEYTKLLPYLEAKDKIYRVTILLGKTSDTYDVDGIVEDVISAYQKPILADVEQILSSEFTGPIQQMPPRFSAIQINGQRAYDLARKGQSFTLKPRAVQIFSNRVLSYAFPRLELEVHCSSGTYIRSLAHDLGERLGCGGVVEKLRREAVGNLSMLSPDLHELIKKVDQLNADNLAAALVPPRAIFKGADILELADEEYAVLARGNFIRNRHVAKEGMGYLLAFWHDQPVGALEPIENGEKLKFSRKLNIL